MRRLRFPSKATGTRQTWPSARTRPTCGAARCERRSRAPTVTSSRRARTSPSHIDGHATVTFGALAWMGGASPEWIAETGSCSATYCHGGTLAGGALTAPVWNRGAAEAACGACHGLPPPPPHVQNPDCGRCHVGYTATSVVAATHVDGKVDLKRLECNGCHGSDDERRPAHRDRRRDRHDGPRGRRAPAAPARRRHPLAPRVHGLPRPPVRDAPRERNRRAPLGRARDRRRRDDAGLEPRDRDVRGDLLPWRHAHARRRRGAHRSRLDAGRRRSGACGSCHAAPPGAAAPPADRLRPVPPWHDDRRWRASTSRVASTSTAPWTSRRSPARCAMAPRA